MPDVTMPNYGLIQGLANGLKEGLVTYQTMSNLKHQQKMQELAAGVTRNPQTGELEPTPESLLKRQAESAKNQQEIDMRNPESDLSKRVVGAGRGLLESSQAGAGQALPENMSAAEFKEISPIVKSDMSGQYGLLGRQMTGQRIDRRLGMQQENMQMKANKDYSNEVGPAEKQLYNANRVLEISNKIGTGDLQSTKQLRADLSSALAQMLSGGKPATVYGMQHQDFDSLYARAQNAQQFLSGTTGDTMTPQQLNQLKKDVKALRDEYALQHKQQYESFKEGLGDSVVPKLDNRFNKVRSTVLAPHAETEVKSHPQDSAAVQWAKSNPSDPRSAAILKANGL